MKVLVSAPYMARDRERCAQLLAHPDFSVVWADVEERLEEDDLLGCIEGVDGIICGDDRITRRVLEKADRLKVIVKWGTGIDSIDIESAEAMGISVHRTPNAFTDPVADTAVGMILAFCRGLFANDSVLKSGGWDKPAGAALFEKTVGIVGFGTIGQAVAARLQPFGARLLATDIVKVEPKVSEPLGVRMVALQELLADSDFVTLHCDLNPTSLHLIDKASLALAKRAPVIINTARGPVVDEPSLVAALVSGGVSGAGLDVYEDEPLPVASPLRSMEQVILSAHNSNSSPECWQRVHRNSVAMLLEGLGLG